MAVFIFSIYFLSILAKNKIMENERFIVTDELLASRGHRFLNYIIDIVIIYVIIIVLTFILAIVASVFGNTEILLWLQNISDLEGYLIFFLIMIPYFTLMETFFSRTVAKYITQTMVVLEDGSKPKSDTILKRTFSRIIPFDGLSFLGSPCRGWHDSISDTYVVKKNAFNLKKELFSDFNDIGKEIEI